MATPGTIKSVSTSPQVSIIVPLFNDEDHLAAALDSCVAQTLRDVEVICVDDASTDQTVAIAAAYAARDPRVLVITQPKNMSAFQARRVGVESARAPFVLFLDGDDELSPSAAETTLREAREHNADVVGFGVQVIASAGDHPKRFEAALQPEYSELTGQDIVTRLFPVGREANGHIWRYLFATDLLRKAYSGLDEEARFYRANDLPITFLAVAHASRYRSVAERLYRYHFRRGTSGHSIDTIEQFRFLMSGVRPISAIADSVRRIATTTARQARTLEAYESARLHIIGNVLRNCARHVDVGIRDDCVRLLIAEVGLEEAAKAATFAPEAVPLLAASVSAPEPPQDPRSVIITTANLRIGGLQGVVVAQAGQLVDRGFNVTIAVMDAGRHLDLPPGVNLVEITGTNLREKLDAWADLCRATEADIILDHHILYNEVWPLYALVALGVGAPTIGWVHNFALRPLFDGTTRGTYLLQHMPVLLKVVVLSPTDVAYWKLRGIERVVYLPNPPSELASAALDVGYDRVLQGRPELVWWGRLDPATKQIDHLLKMAASLKKRGASFRLRIIGPDSRRLSAREVARQAAELGVDDSIQLMDNRSPAQLLEELRDAHVFVMTSAIEGSPLTLLEAQALGLPVFMYDLPWLDRNPDLTNIVTIAQGDPDALAAAVLRLIEDPAAYAAASASSRIRAQSIAELDTGSLVVDLILNRLSPDYSPQPTLGDARLLLQLSGAFADRHIRYTQRTSRNIDKLRQERNTARRKLNEVKSGASFRIGRLITHLPRLIKYRLEAQRAAHATSSRAR